MSEFEDIQRLIRLKRFEQPGEGFTDDFLRQFHQRQRAEMLKQSSLELFFERATTWWNHLTAPKWGLTAAAVVICATGVWLITGTKSTTEVTAVPVPVPMVPEKPFVSNMDLSELPMANITARNNSKLEESLLRKHLEIRPALEGNVSPLPANANGLEGGTAKKVIPAGAADGQGR
jgi:hypothetical protein